MTAIDIARISRRDWATIFSTPCCCMRAFPEGILGTTRILPVFADAYNRTVITFL